MPRRAIAVQSSERTGEAKVAQLAVSAPPDLAADAAARSAIFFVKGRSGGDAGLIRPTYPELALGGARCSELFHKRRSDCFRSQPPVMAIGARSVPAGNQRAGHFRRRGRTPWIDQARCIGRRRRQHGDRIRSPLSCRAQQCKPPELIEREIHERASLVAVVAEVRPVHRRCKRAAIASQSR